MRQLLTESLLLAVVGGVLGLAVAEVGVRALVALSPAGLPRLDAIRVRERAALRRAGEPAEQKRAALALWRAYDTAANQLGPLAPRGQPAAFVVVALRDAARAYRALGVAADRQSARAWTSARTAVRDAERELERELAVA